MASIVILSLSITTIALLSYRRTRNNKILHIAVGFCLFFIKGVVLTITLFTGLLELEGSSIYVLAILITIDLLILIALYLSIFKR